MESFSFTFTPVQAGADGQHELAGAHGVMWAAGIGSLIWVAVALLIVAL